MVKGSTRNQLCTPPGVGTGCTGSSMRLSVPAKAKPVEARLAIYSKPSSYTHATLMTPEVF